MRRATALALTAVCVAACSPGGPGSSSTDHAYTGDVTVFAAASLAAPFAELGARFHLQQPATHVRFSFGGSSTLASQITQGAPADVFASADSSNMATVTSAGLGAGPPRVFAHNLLAIVVPRGNPRHIRSLGGLASPGLVLALCAPQVPCGRYAEELLKHAHVTVKPSTLELDVKAVVRRVASGNADAGIVYVSDVRSAGPAVEAVSIPRPENVLASYPILLLKGSQNAGAARAFIDFVLGPTGREVLAQYGFTPP